jgi:hypothetical protein
MTKIIRPTISGGGTNADARTLRWRDLNVLAISSLSRGLGLIGFALAVFQLRQKLFVLL